jgi:hypothetical protein
MTTAEDGRTPRGTRLARPARRKQLLGAAHELFVATATTRGDGRHRRARRRQQAGAVPALPEQAGAVLRPARPARRRPAGQGPAALDSTTDNKARVAASVAAYFDFVDGKGSDVEGAFRLVFESDLRNDPAVRERVERMTRDCADAIAETIAHDTGYRPEEAQLLSIG